MAYDVNLGREIHRLLEEKGLETPAVFNEGVIPVTHTLADLQSKFMTELGLNLEDDSLKDTPNRVAKMYKEELFMGLDYARFPTATTFENKAQYDELLAVTCTLESTCEHHFLPFIGKCWVGYIPGTRFLGLSKFNRIVDFFARRPQVQERLTAQISEALQFILDTKDVAVVIKAEHYCTMLRGIKDKCAETTTSQLRGKFRDVPELRAEFIGLSRLAV